MSKAAMDSVIEEVVAPLGIGKGKQTVVTEMRRREAVRRTWLEVDISELRMLALAMAFYGCPPQAINGKAVRKHFSIKEQEKKADLC